MSDKFQNPPTPEMQLETPALISPAILHCLDVMRNAALEAMQDIATLDQEGPSAFKDQAGEVDFKRVGVHLKYAERISTQAYREAMPPLIDEEHIRDFIACVAHGMVLRVFEANEGSKLLYAAQVASQAQAKRPKP